MLMMIGRLLGAVVTLLLMFAGRRELMRMLIVSIRLADNAVAATRFRLHSRYTSGGQERCVPEVNGSVGRR